LFFFLIWKSLRKSFFNLFFSDSSSFAKDFHVARGDSQIEVGYWTDERSGKKRREVKFLSPTSTSQFIRNIAGETVNVIETQYYHFISEELIIETSTKVEGSMSESFSTSATWNISPSNGNKESTCKITVQNDYKGTWFKAKIEDFIHSSSVEAFDKYRELITQRVSEFRQRRIVQAPSRPIPKSKPSHKTIMAESETDTDDEFFDTENELFPQNPEISKFLQDLSRDISKVRSSIEASETRLLAVEAAFLNVQEKYVPSINTNSKNFQENLIQYFKRLDELTKQLEEEKRTRDNEKILAKKIDQLSSSLNRSNIKWTVTLLLLFVAWPSLANNAWKFAKTWWTRRA